MTRMTAITEPAPPHADDVEPCAQRDPRPDHHRHRSPSLPVLCLFFVAWQVWGAWLGWNDIFVFLIMYVADRAWASRSASTGCSRTARSRPSPFMRGVFAVCGSMAIEGPVISWVADHRKHHAFSDRPGDPHSPHVDHGSGWRGAIKGLVHAHVGWLFLHTHRGRRTRYAPDLIADPVVSRVDKLFVPCVALGLIAPFCLGWLFGGTLRDGFTGLLWGGAVRVLVLHHATYSINSLCHFFGRRRFATKDESRNLLWLAPLTFGEAWHNNHHAFPTSAAHGLRRWEFDPSALVIDGLEKVGLAWDVVRVTPRAAGHQVRCRGLSTEAAAHALAEVAAGPALPDRPVGRDRGPVDHAGDGPTFTVRSPVALGHMLRAPGQLGLGRAYVTGALEVDDIDKTLALLDGFARRPSTRRRRLRLRRARRSRPARSSRSRARPRSSCGPQGRRHSIARDKRAGDVTTTTSRTTSSRCSSTSR